MNTLDILQSITGYSSAVSQAGSKSLRIALIDTDYSPSSYPSTLPRLLFEGETTLSVKFYSVAGPYVPRPGDRVVVAPVGNSYVILGALNTPDPLLYALSGLASSYVAGQQTRSSSAFDTISGGPEVTVNVRSSGRVLLMWGARINFDSASPSEAHLVRMRIMKSGANTGVVGSDDLARVRRNAVTTANDRNKYAFIVDTELTPGSTTFTVQYAVSSASAHFSDRVLIAVPL